MDHHVGGHYPFYKFSSNRVGTCLFVKPGAFDCIFLPLLLKGAEWGRAWRRDAFLQPAQQHQNSRTHLLYPSPLPSSSRRSRKPALAIGEEEVRGSTLTETPSGMEYGYTCKKLILVLLRSMRAADWAASSRINEAGNRQTAPLYPRI